MHPMMHHFSNRLCRKFSIGVALTGCGVTGSPTSIQISEPTLNAGHGGASGRRACRSLQRLPNIREK
jgi:hypothetical protein